MKKNHPILRLRNILIILILPLLTFAQNPTPLTKGITIEKPLKAGEKHNYTISLKPQQFFLAQLNQKGIDIIITAYNSKGEKIADFDSPNGQNGLEPIKLIDKEAGEYRLEVRPLEKEVDPGTYSLVLSRQEAVATSPEGRVDQLFSPWDRKDAPGAALAVVKDGEIVFSKGYGLANMEYNIPNSPTTIFHIASVSKQFTAFAITLLAQEGKLSLDDDIRKYLPEVPEFDHTITIRHLAHHTSGLRDQWNLLAMAGWRLDDVITKEHVLKLVSRQKDLNFKPGDEYLYCNTGFTLMAEIVERVSGRSFADWTAENIFEPLGMKNTLFYDDHEKIVPNRAYSYYQSQNGYKKSVLSYANVGATSLFTTVEDLSKWAMNFESMKLGNKKLMDQMHQKGVLNNGKSINYALGQGIGLYKGLELVSHGGADAGYRTYLGRFPEQDFSVIVFSNLASFNPGGMALEIADIYLEKDFPKQRKNNGGGRNPFSSSKSISLSDVQLSAFTGTFYSEELGTSYTFFEKDGKLMAKHQRNSDIVLKPTKADSFRGDKWYFRQITFVRGKNKEIAGCRVSNGRVRDLWFEKMN